MNTVVTLCCFGCVAVLTLMSLCTERLAVCILFEWPIHAFSSHVSGMSCLPAKYQVAELKDAILSCISAVESIHIFYIHKQASTYPVMIKCCNKRRKVA